MRDGVRFSLLEDFKQLPAALQRQPRGERWDLLVVDEFMTAEIVSTGDALLLAMYAEVEAPAGPIPQPTDPDITLVPEGGTLKLKAFTRYPMQGTLIYHSIIKKINEFRRTLAALLAVSSK
ncbi:hypothetical protein [Thermofilum pendens]|uniref:Uncharacterized protein n=1 Tax=Thermofilum pendens (strain DSM 2475 / Hrk 5) TaxID=368408 RepID=A1RW60_THEPD|nr:hypothetical protein [Thermofilum pendens]ABL77440.1 hypothetical protein Tpen_0030 [Thermofilum pendens Hrk 5]